MDCPEISVIIPVYNRAEMLIEAVESVVFQNYPNLELIIVDDGSTDNWKAKLKTTYGSDRFVTVEIEHCGFPGKVRNTGIRAAKGEYIAFLDSDDIWLEGKLFAQLEAMRASGLLLCHTREIWDRKGQIVSQRKQRHQREGALFNDALKKCIIGPSTVLLNKTIFDECGVFREDLEIAEDYEMWLRIADRYQVCYVDKPLVRKRAGEWPQLSEKYGTIEFFRIDALKYLVDKHVFSAEHHRSACNELSAKCGIYAAGCAKRGRYEEADKYRQLAARYKV